MADSKISDLTEDTSPDRQSDFVVTVDTSAGANKKVKLVNLGPAGTFDGALVKKSTDQTGANYTTETALSFDAEIYDTNAWHDNSSNNTRLTVPIGVSMVQVFANIEIQNVTADTWQQLRLFKNGSSGFDGGTTVVTEIGATTVNISFVSPPISCAATDFFEIKLRTESDTAIDIIAAKTSFGIKPVNGLMTEFSGCMVKKSVDQTSANYTSNTAIAWNAETYDLGGWHDNVTNNTRITVPSGVTRIQLQANVAIASMNADIFYKLEIQKNGSASFEGATANAAEQGSTSTNVNICTPVLEVTAGDYFEAFLIIESDTSVTITAQQSSFAAQKIT